MSDGTASGAPQLSGLDGLIDVSTVDGVPVLTAPGGGRVSGGIVFRVGWADERLARSGVSHLVEHLALFGQNLTDVHHNGSTGEYATHFHATGSTEEVVRFLNGVCEALRGLPHDRIEVEKGILHTEASRRGAHPSERLRLERYGAQGSGLRMYEGFGLDALTADDVSEWATERFTRQNAVAWLTTERVPDGLDLRLPSGERRPIPVTRDRIGETPASFVGAQGVVVIDAVVPSTVSALMFSTVASRALFRRVRQEGGLSYDVTCDWERVDPDRARLTVFADALPEKQSALVGEVVDVLADLRAGTIAEDDIVAARSAFDDLREGEFLGARLLPTAAFDLAAGVDTRGPQRVADEMRDLGGADLAEVARRFWEGAVAQIPEGRLDWAGFRSLPAWSEREIEGRSHPSLAGDPGELVVGAEGVMVREGRAVVTVGFSETEALERWPDGARRLTGADGFRILIEPTLWSGVTADAIAAIDAAVPDDVHVSRPPRPSEAIPRPAAADGTVGGAR